MSSLNWLRDNSPPAVGEWTLSQQALALKGLLHPELLLLLLLLLFSHTIPNIILLAPTVLLFLSVLQSLATILNSFVISHYCCENIPFYQLIKAFVRPKLLSILKNIMFLHRWEDFS